MRRGCAVWAILTWAWTVPASSGALPAPAPGAAVSSTDPGGADLLILDLQLDRRPLTSGMTGYLRRGEVLLPLGEMARALEFPIHVEPGEGAASGWFLKENRRFSLSLERREVVVEGRRGELDPERIEARPEDVYVDSSLLSRWFPVELEIELSRLVVNVKPREKLPVQQRLERQALWRQLRRRPGAAPAAYPAVEVPYRLLDWPTLDGTLTLGSVADPEGRVRPSLRHQALFTGDLLFLTGELFLDSGGRRDAPDPSPRLQLQLGRKDPDASLLGPLHARELGLGAVVSPERPLLSASRPGQGLVLSSFPIDSLDEYDRVTLRGQALPGWEAELYQNGMLLDFQTLGEEGRYAFSGVPLLFGVNLFRLIFYGPEGQRREEERRYVIGDGLIRRGESHYRLAVSRPDLQSTSTGAEPGQAEKAHSSFEFEHGLGHGLAAAVSFDNVITREGRESYGGVSLRGSAGGAFARLDLAVRSDGGWATRTSIQTRFAELNLSARYDQYQGFVSEQVPASPDPLRSRGELHLDGSLPGALPRPLIYSLSLEQQRHASGASGTQLSARLAGGSPALLLSNLWSLDLQGGGGGGARAPALKGSLLVNARHGRSSLRGQVGYRLRPTAGLGDVSLTPEWDFGGERRLRFGINRAVLPSPSARFLTGVSWRFAGALLGADLAYETRRRGTFAVAGGGSVGGHGLSISLTLAYSWRREPLSGNWQMSSRRAAEEGAATARVFLDHDLDGHFGPGDEPLAGVRFATEGSILRGTTDGRGIVRLSGLPLYRPAQVGLNVGSLEDPLWVPAAEGFGFTPRPGTAPVLEFPVVTSGEIEGTVALRKVQGTTRMANLPLQLLAPDGTVVRTARSEYDGFFLFERVPPGRYRLRLEPTPVRRLGLVPPPERAVEIGPEGATVRGVDMLLEEAAPSRDPLSAVTNSPSL